MSLSPGAVLAAIRATEGNPAYDQHTGNGGASGAYQFIDSTWKANGGTTDHAWQATPEEQDAVAARKAQAALAGRESLTDDDQLLAVASAWYLGHPAGPGELDQIPHPEAGNKLTVRQYAQKFAQAYANAVVRGVGTGSAWDQITGAAGKVVDKTAQAVIDALGSLSEPFVKGLQRITILGLAVALGVGMVGLGAWRSVRPAGG